MNLAAADAPWVCRPLFEELCVNANGDMVCSCADPSGIRVFGNVFRDRIAGVYDGPVYRAARVWQLEAEPGSYCPVIGTSCGGRVSRATASDLPTGRSVRLLQLEPVSACNLRCPGCPSTQMRIDPDYRGTPGILLPLATMLDVVDQLPDLEMLLFYNFGEPFVHPEAIPFLRELRRRRPDVVVRTSTNGLVLSPAAIDAIASEALVDRIVFSIDGAFPESYRRYRQRGDLGRALAKLEALIASCAKHGTRGRVDILWQYILFEWNDSDAEIEAARRRAAELDVQLRWIITHTAGASQKYLDGSEAAQRLLEGPDTFEALTCERRMEHVWKHGGVAGGRYAARLTLDRPVIEGGPGSRVLSLLTIENRSASDWDFEHEPIRVGLRLRSATGRVLGELPGVSLGIASLAAGERDVALLDVELPDAPFEGELFIDLVEQGVCWFSERSSAPLVVPLRVRPRAAPPLPVETIVARAYELLLEQSDPEGRAHWTAQLGAGLQLGNFLSMLRDIARARGAISQQRLPIRWASVLRHSISLSAT